MKKLTQIDRKCRMTLQTAAAVTTSPVNKRSHPPMSKASRLVLLSGAASFGFLPLVGIVLVPVVLRCVCDLKRDSEGLLSFILVFFKFVLLDSVQCHVDGSYVCNDQRCYDWTKSKSQLFRILIGICGFRFYFNPWSRFVRLHFFHIYKFLL